MRALPSPRRFYLGVLFATFSMASSAQAFDYTITGVINWTDPANNLHPTRGVTVQLLNSNGTVVDASGTVDMTGAYSLTFSSLSPFGFTENLRVMQTNIGGYVSSDATPDNIYLAYTQSFSVGVVGINTINVNMQNTPGDAFASPGFSVDDALLTGYQYAVAVRGAAPAQLPALYPQPDKDGTFFSPGNTDIHILAQDRWDWDVILHEYSHYLQNLDKLANNPGGSHQWGVSNIPARGKSAGIRLGWGEGLADYQAIAAQFVANGVAGNNVPNNLANVLDTHYQDTEDQTLDIDLATNTGPTAHGEGDELAVARIMWWIGDPVNGTTDRVNRGHVQVYKDLVAAAAANGGTLQSLSQINNYYLNTVATSDKIRTDYGAIFQANSVSPVPTDLTGQIFLASGTGPKFTWTAGNDGANENFHLIIWDDNGLTHRVIDNFQIPGDGTLNYTLSAAQWALVSATSGTKWYDITGSDLKDGTGTAYAGIEATGAFWSDAYSFVAVPEPGSLAILVVGIMALRRRRS